jgi:hypothetical protein
VSHSRQPSVLSLVPSAASCRSQAHHNATMSSARPERRKGGGPSEPVPSLRSAHLDPEDKRDFGYSRDKPSDCLQLAITLAVAPEGFPQANEVLPGSTSGNTTLKDSLE